VTLSWTLLLLLGARRLAPALLPIQLLCSLSFLRLMLLVTLSACMTRHSTHVAEELLLGFPQHDLASVLLLRLLLLRCLRRSPWSIRFELGADRAQPLRVPRQFSRHNLAFCARTVFLASNVLEGQVHLCRK
jgi:hypothetical protein